MTRTIGGGVLVWLVLVCATAASGEDKPIGLTIVGYSPAVGVLLPVTHNCSIRPEFQFSRNSFDGGSFGSTSDGWSTTFGIGALFYLNQDDALRTYVSPRFVYSHSSTTTIISLTDLSSITGIPTSSTSSGSQYGVAGSFGAQYGFGKRFGVFGEMGIGYSRSTSDSQFGADYRSSSLGLHSAVGVIVFF